MPAAIFRLERTQVASFLARLFTTDGSAWWTDAGNGYGRITYASVSRQLVLDVSHLLLRFGICARTRPRSIFYNGQRRPAWELEIMAAPDIRRFCDEIGIFRQEKQPVDGYGTASVGALLAIPGTPSLLSCGLRSPRQGAPGPGRVSPSLREYQRLQLACRPTQSPSSCGRAAGHSTRVERVVGLGGVGPVLG